MKLGFQQKDPASDLRGAGIAGVRHLTCFLRSHDADYRAATAAGPDHCVALASLNLTLLLRAYLQLNLDGETLQPVCRGGNLRGSPEMRRRFLAWEQDTGNAFEYLHGTLLAYMLGRLGFGLGFALGLGLGLGWGSNPNLARLHAREVGETAGEPEDEPAALRRGASGDARLS